MKTPASILRFEAFQLDWDNRQLRKHGLPIELGSRYFDALALLVSRRGELVTKDVFMKQVWRGIPVTDEALTQCIRTLRRALGDDAANPRFIETVPKHGYRFVAQQSTLLQVSLRAQGSHIAGACTLAGLASGVVAGLIYGMIAATGGGAQVLVLAAMIGALGLLAGAGLGAGMAAALTWRGRADGWVVAGTAIGGLAVGALGNLLGRESVGLLSGVSIANVTGPFEGVVLGTAAGVAAWAALAYAPKQEALGKVFLTGTAAAVGLPDNPGDTEDNLYLSGDAVYGIAKKPISLKAHIGYSDGNAGLGPTGTSVAPTGTYFDWSLGADVTPIEGLTLSVSYIDTDISAAESAYLQPNFSLGQDSTGSIAGSTVVASVTAAF